MEVLSLEFAQITGENGIHFNNAATCSGTNGLLITSYNPNRIRGAIGFVIASIALLRDCLVFFNV